MEKIKMKIPAEKFNSFHWTEMECVNFPILLCMAW